MISGIDICIVTIKERNPPQGKPPVVIILLLFLSLLLLLNDLHPTNRKYENHFACDLCEDTQISLPRRAHIIDYLIKNYRLLRGW